jgi:hypothetical protein
LFKYTIFAVFTGQAILPFGMDGQMKIVKLSENPKPSPFDLTKPFYRKYKYSRRRRLPLLMAVMRQLVLIAHGDLRVISWPLRL